MTRVQYTTLLFFGCIVIGAAATLWMGYTVVRLDKEQMEAQAAAALEETVRLALWRMDSALGPFVASESMRPYEHYSAFYRAPEAVNATNNFLCEVPVLMPSPLLTYDSPYIRLHFQLDGAGNLTSPQVPDTPHQALAQTNYLMPGDLSHARAQLDALRPELNFGALATCVEAVTTADERTPPVPATRSESDSMISNVVELRSRKSQALTQQNSPPLKILNNDASELADPTTPGSARPWREGPIAPVWAGNELLLVRTVGSGGITQIQGCWLDWPAIQHWLLGLCNDLLPNARLTPVSGPAPTQPDDAGRLLASLPLRLVPGQTLSDAPSQSPIRMYLLIAGGGIALSTLAVSLLLWGTFSLSERRARFVAAVSHELRTPLTTFRLYTEMLAGGMVPEGQKRQLYLDTLYTEANRLGHLVENVLAYARLENHGNGTTNARADLVEGLNAMKPRLEERAAQGAMSLEIACPDEAVFVKADLGLVEQIVYNLVDNACKYAGNREEKRILVHLVTTDGTVELRVIDYGPGIPKAERRRVFRPFTKSVQDAARSAPGVGLGLGLSRRIARNLGGNLVFEAREIGASFLLRLPRVP